MTNSSSLRGSRLICSKRVAVVGLGYACRVVDSVFQLQENKSRPFFAEIEQRIETLGGLVE